MIHRIPRRSAVVLVVLHGLVAGGCSRGADTSAQPPTTTTAAFASLHESLCDSLRAAESGDVATAEARFADAHGGLHDLAAAVAEEGQDRAVAARLLESKRKVEQAGAGVGVGELRLLAATAAEAVAAIGGAAPADCE